MSCPIQNDISSAIKCQYHETGVHCPWYGTTYTEPLTTEERRRRAYGEEYFQKNKEQIRERNRQYRAKVRNEKKREYEQRYREKKA
jgi:hypothetical protein